MKKLYLLIIISICLFSITSCKLKGITYNVNFDSDGGTNVAQQTVFSGYPAIEPKNPIKEGYNFIEWQLNDEPYSFATKVAKDITLKAIWEKAEYVVSFISNDDNTVPSQMVDYNGLVNEPSTPDRVGYTFIEWQLNGQKYDFTNPVQSNLLLVAKYQLNEYNVTFDTDGGSVVNKQKVKHLDTANEPVNPTKKGYNFVEWQLNGERYTFYTPVVKDIELEAIWTIADYVITFDTNGGNSINSQTLYFNELVEKPANPVRPGYEFIEWQLNGQKYDFTTPVESNMTLVAIWEEITCYHVWDNACDESCNLCGKIRTISHDWINANYMRPKTCLVCGLTEGEPIICDEHSDSNKDYYCDACQIELDSYKPKWTPNMQTSGWNGQGMKVVILVSDVSEIDPFDSNYIKDDKLCMQKQIRLVEAAYGIDLVFSGYSAPWGPSRIKYIQESYRDEYFSKNDIYGLEIPSNWISQLIKGNCISELAEINSAGKAVSGIFTEIGYEEAADNGEYIEGICQQNATANQVVSRNNKVYGYVYNDVRPDYFMYYNADLIEQAGMEEPAELWLKGEWTMSNFTDYCYNLQEELDQTQYVFTNSFAELIIGLTASTGNSIATRRPSLSLVSSQLLDKFYFVRNLFANGLYVNRNIEDVSYAFLEGNGVFSSGYMWFVNDESRFNPNQCNFTIGVVPYPTDDGNGGQPITTSKIEEAILDREGREITTASGEYISGIDMSQSSFNIPVLSTNCLSIINTENGKNGITNKIVFAILYDVFSGLGYDMIDEKQSEDEKYYNYLVDLFDYPIYAEVVMSAQTNNYYEMIEVLTYDVCGGSLIGYGSSFWTVSANICKRASLDPKTALQEIYGVYEDAITHF